MPSKKKVQKSFEKFAKASARKNLVPTARAMSAATTPTATSIQQIADADTDAAIADYAQRSTEQAAADFAALPQPSYSRGEQESTAPRISPTDQLAHVTVPAPSQVASIPPLASPMHAAAVAALDAIIPRNHR